ncbi:C6 zinc finger domain-containing protein [Xylaria intraflava]|nr:C6 zinc finger domain-containing protein [Xylaria intraflava]
MAEEATSAPKPSAAPTRKKFSVPPVKIACLACRASRTRCNGENPCVSCVTKGRECVYKPSRRGGPRIRKKSRLGSLSDYQDLATSLATSLSPKIEELPQSRLIVEDYIGPGAGLKPLADVFQDSDAIYDHLFQSAVNNAPFNVHVPIVRTYGDDDRSILNAYYIWIHPYFPILPPPEQVPAPDLPLALTEHQNEGFSEPSSAIALAISAILALIPCPHDPQPLSAESVRWRRTYAQFLAKASLESIENESERPDSSIDLSTALSDAGDEVNREKFHPQVPLEIENIIALDILSVYEYAQRGNLKKMKARAGAALVAAMPLSLHTKSSVEDEYSEARRRAWWMTYICICQASIVSNTPPTFEIFSSSYTANYPTIRADSEAWPTFVRAQQAILAATQFVIDFEKVRKAGTDVTRIFRRMKDLEKLLEPLIIQTDMWSSNYSLTQPVDRNEAVLANSLRCMSRIKLNSARIKVHRYCAFFDVALFSSKHCDLASLPKGDDDSSGPQLLQACCVSALNSSPAASGHSAESLSPEAYDTPSAEMNNRPQPSLPDFPFSSHESSRVCLKSALNIAAAFDTLPYPNPSGQLSEAPVTLNSGSNFVTPRTMPSFACCAMQCSYALLMIRERTESLYPKSNGGNGLLVENLRKRLQQGLFTVLATLENYGTAFEALGGMRDQVREKVDDPFNLDA